MPTATTIVVAREDLSIPGGEDINDNMQPRAISLETRFFSLLRESQPDVVLLDLSRANGHGVETISKIRRQSTIPILVVYGGNEDDARNYRIAGAAECIQAPIDVVMLNQILQQIVRVMRQALPPAPREAGTVAFAGLKYHPRQNLVTGPEETAARLTTAESRLLAQFIARPWELQTRIALAETLYGKHRPASDRAIDVIVNRLRKKLVGLSEAAQYLIKTEFRRGYRFVSDVAVEP